MEVIVIEIAVYNKLINKVNQLSQKVKQLTEGHEIKTKEWLDVADVCEILKVSKRTLYDYRKRNLIDFSFIDNKVFFKREDVDRFIQKNRK